MVMDNKCTEEKGSETSELEYQHDTLVAVQQVAERGALRYIVKADEEEAVKALRLILQYLDGRGVS